MAFHRQHKPWICRVEVTSDELLLNENILLVPRLHHYVGRHSAAAELCLQIAFLAATVVGAAQPGAVCRAELLCCQCQHHLVCADVDIV